MGKGTGLGLATVFGIVSQHNGFVNVYSEPGKGTTFHIYFPALDEKETVAVEKIKKSVADGTETILVVEDDENLCRLIATVLQSYHYNIITANDGEEGLE